MAKDDPGTSFTEAVTTRVLHVDRPCGVLGRVVVLTVREGDLGDGEMGLTLEHPVSHFVADM